MKTSAKLLALALLLALKPACGGGGGGGGAPAATASFPALPALIAPVPTAGGATGLTPVSTAAPTPTTITVTGMVDKDVTDALQTALTAGGNIVMTNGGAPRTIVVYKTLSMPSNSGTPKTVVLDGSGDITLSGGLQRRILEVEDEAQITVQRMKFIDARSPQSGAALNGNARVRLVTIINCSFDNCQTTQGGPDQGGGAMRFANGSWTFISGCTFNKCAGSNGGAVNSLGTRLTIRNSTFTQNMAFGVGGGAEVGPSGQGGIGGAVYVDNVSNDPAATHQLEIAGCVFNANIANDHAGALFGYTNPAVPSTTIIDKCTFAGNVVAGGHGHSGGVYSQAGTLTLTNSTFNANSAASSGGGIFSSNTSAAVTNCTFQGNTCGNLGAGIFAPSGNITLLNCTLSQNSAGNFSGGMHTSVATTTIQNCIFDRNKALGNIYAGDQVNDPCAGGGNLQAPNTGPGNKPASTAGTTFTTDAMLGPLQDNTGPTFTMRPGAGSPAINLVTVTGAPANDQRGAARSGAADCGACEGP